MLTTVEPIEFSRKIDTGKTKPSLLVCEKADGATIEVVAKFSGGCESQEASLVRETIAACLAADLGLPVPQPYIILVPPEWENIVSDPGRRQQIAQSCRTAFGSTYLTGQYSLWTSGTMITDEMLPTAAAIFVFDALTQNSDRRASNPNCLVKGKQIRIFDHELTFPTMLLGFIAPWRPGGLKSLENNENHAFRQALVGRQVDYSPIKAAWQNISDVRIGEYGQSVPKAWAHANVVAQNSIVAKALSSIKDARDNIDGCLAEVERVLK
ncbi:MAG: hypothetical protein IPK59_00680 [Rhodospirillaceae bacterium]|nr:hypothetical protein [Rhodospirillaceae bacterium]